MKAAPSTTVLPERIRKKTKPMNKQVFISHSIEGLNPATYKGRLSSEALICQQEKVGTAVCYSLSFLGIRSNSQEYLLVILPL